MPILTSRVKIFVEKVDGKKTECDAFDSVVLAPESYIPTPAFIARL